MDKNTRHKALHPHIPPDAEKPKLIEKAEDALSIATIQLLTNQPFFGQLLCGLRRIPTWDFPTMGVDGVNLFYNPAFVLALEKPVRRAVLCHEVMHLALRHIQRRQNHQSHKLWNCACDYAVNAILIEDLSMQLPEWTLYRREFSGLAAEEIYKKLLDENKGKSGSGSGADKAGSDQGQGDADPDCPYCQQEAGDKGSWDEHFSNPNLDEAALTDRIIRAADQAKKRGQIPLGVERLVQNLRDPKVDWRKFIRGQALNIFEKVDYHGGVRSILTGCVAGGRTFLPGLAKKEAALLVLVVDTSGSISADILNEFASEIRDVVMLADRTIVMTADAKVHEIAEIDKFDEIFNAVKFKGGGGTDFRPAFNKIAELGLCPNLLVYFTDGYGTFPETVPDYPVLWAFTKEHSPAPWGESVIVQA